jgi:hypothetical protein
MMRILAKSGRLKRTLVRKGRRKYVGPGRRTRLIRRRSKRQPRLRGRR